MGKFLPGNPGRPKGIKNKKKIIKVEDFVRDNNINVAQEWWQTIMQINKPDERAAAIREYYKFVGTPPKETSEVEDEPITESADILSIIKK